MDSNFYEVYPMVDLRPAELMNFLNSPGWRAIKQILEADRQIGLAELLNTNSTESMDEVNVRRGKISAYTELLEMDEIIKELLTEEVEDVEEQSS